MYVDVMSASVPPYVGSASYAPCPECREGALTWDPVEGTSTCGVCENAR